MKKYLLLFILLSFSACTKKTSIILKAENVENLSDKSKIFINGFEIGQIKKISLNPNGFIIINAELDSETRLPQDSKFQIEDAGLMGPKIINVKIGNSKKNVSEKDTIVLTRQESILATDTANVVNKIITKLTKSNDCDSIKSELTKLNNRIENLEKQ